MARLSRPAPSSGCATGITAIRMTTIMAMITTTATTIITITTTRA